MIATPRLIVRHLDADDYEAYRQLQDDASVKEFTRGSLPPVSKEYGATV